MDTQKLQSYQKTQPGVPSKFEERFLLKRIDEEDVELSLNERNGILASLNRGDKFIQVRKYTFMLNAIKSIEPMWGENNIPPRPKEETKAEYRGDVAYITVINKAELDEWDSLFKNKQLNHG